MRVFADAALHLGATVVPATVDEPAEETRALLRSFALDRDALTADERAAASRLLSVAARMERIFGGRLPGVAGAMLVGATVHPAAFGLAGEPRDVSGKGLGRYAALGGCVGEAVEYLATCPWPARSLQDVAAARLPEGVAELRTAASATVPCLPAVRLGRPGSTWMPVDLCARTRADAVAAPLLRSGYGAGATLAEASLAAVLEAVERDAAALWWEGGRPARVLSPVSLAPLEGEGACLASLRRGSRRTSLLDLTTDVGIPVVAALATGPDGRDLACGLAAGLDLAQAGSAALLELAQMEFALGLARRKAATGDGVLSETDRRHLARANVSVEALPVSLSSGPAATGTAAAMDPDERLAWVAGALGLAGIECFLVDMSRPEVPIPCARALAPRLQTLPVASVTDRLKKARGRRKSPGRRPSLL